MCLMSVNPGFGGQSFIERTYAKTRAMRSLLDEEGAPEALIEIDGGVGVGNAKALVDAGANVLVAGSSVFRAEHPLEAASRPGLFLMVAAFQLGSMNGGAFLNTFFRRQGHWMVLANVATKVLGFAAVALRHTPHYGARFRGVFIRQKHRWGTGAAHGFWGLTKLFFGFPLMHPVNARKSRCTSMRLGGILFSLVLVAFLHGLAPWLCNAIPESVSVFRVLIWVIFSTLLMESVKGYARAIHRNAISAKLDLTYAALLVIATLAFTQGMGILGYAFAVVISPLLASIPFGLRMNLWAWEWKPLEKAYSGFWSYGIFTTLGLLLSQLFYAIDVFLIGQHFGEEASVVAVYRVALIVPLASAVLPVSIAATDYMYNALNKNNPSALRAYMLGYWKTFGTLSVGLWACWRGVPLDPSGLR